MKRLLTLALLLTASPAFAAPEVYVFDKTHTNVTWKVEHMGFSRPSGKWMDVDGTVTLDNAKPADSKLDVTINMASIQSGLPKFDEHLKSADFFNTAKFPTARFVSTKVTPYGSDAATINGTLTMLGISKPVTLDVKLNKMGEHPMTKAKMVGFSGTGKIKRSDFGMNYGLPMVADEVSLDIEAEAELKK